MTRFTLKGVAARKLRSLLTALAIVLGVAMVSGTFVLTDTIEKAFGSIFSSSYEQTDAVVSGRKVVEWSQNGKAAVPERLLEEIRQLPEVEAAAGTLVDLSGDADQVQLLDKKGRVIPSDPSFGFGVPAGQERFNPFDLVDGRWSSAADEVVLDAGTASKYGFSIGDTLRAAGAGPVRSFAIVGIARFGEVDTIGTASIAVFDVATAQALHDKDGFDAIDVAATEGVSPSELVRAIRPLLPSSVRVLTAEAQAEQDGAGVDEFVSIIRYFLLGFGGIALFVGAFVIFNTLSITVAQRTRELATLRMLGASRRQLLRSIVVEGLAIGALGSVAGLVVGIGLAKGLSALFRAIDFALPEAGTVVQARTVVISLALGIGITFLASLVPAVRATRVPPLAAVREAQGGGLQRLSWRLTAAAVTTVAVSASALGYGVLGGGVAAGTRVLLMIGGALGLFVGIAMVAPRLVRPLASVLGRPSGWLGGAAGRLARENSIRNPARTAATAAALMIGLTLATFVAVVGRGLVASGESAVRDQMRTEHAVVAADVWDNLPRAVGRSVGAAPGVELASSVRSDQARVYGVEQSVSGVDPTTIARAYRFEWTAGSDATLRSLGRDGALVRSSLAEDERLSVGDPIVLETPAGKAIHVVVRGIFSPPELDPLLGAIVIPQRLFDANFVRPGDAFTLVQTSSPDRLEQVLAAYPSATLKTDEELAAARFSELGTILNLLYVLLALSVLVSLFGMVNTLVLAVFERTRELGMLRAVGMTRRQTRRMIRHEGVLNALIGAGLGIPLGIGAAALVIRSLGKYGVAFSLPTGTLVLFTLVTVFAGMAAAILPARRAARLNILRALQYE
jgi:putative ABC transport system permease protein